MQHDVVDERCHGSPPYLFAVFVRREARMSQALKAVEGGPVTGPPST
jgi:hypothetical protein